MPFKSPQGATFEDFDECVNALSDGSAGMSESDAKAICGSWEEKHKEENSMNYVDVTPLKNQLDEEELQEFKLGEIVSVDGDAGVIAAVVEQPFNFPVGSPGEIETKPDEQADKKEIEASPDNPMYVVALQKGGSLVASADEISGDASLEGEEGEEIESWKEVTDDAPEAELAPVYSYCDNPDSYAELQQAKKEMIMERQAAALADYVDSREMDVAELGEYSYAELVNIRGVDDPETGFSSMPNGWTRKSVLQAWASLGGMWRTCFPRMVRVRGPNFAKRWCAALKDEVLGTEEWRGDF